MKIVRNYPAGVAFADDDYDGDEHAFVLYWDRYTGLFSFGLNKPGCPLRPMQNPQYHSARDFKRAKKLAEHFFSSASEGTS